MTAGQRQMRRLSRWHIWLGWLVAVPLLLWTVSGVLMAARPIDEVRGTYLRLPVGQAPLPSDITVQVALPAKGTKPVGSVLTAMEHGQIVTRLNYLDGTTERLMEDGRRLGAITEAEARQVAADNIVGGAHVVSATHYSADKVPLDFRKPVPVWQLALADGTHVYVGSESGQVEAVRTRWWRFYDVMWGLHIMDLQTREEAHNPFTIAFGILAVLSAMLGAILLFRRRAARRDTAS